MRLIVVLLFAAILASLGSALFYLLRSQSDSSGVVRALTIRIGLSVLLFALLMLAWHFGLIQPHGVEPPAG